MVGRVKIAKHAITGKYAAIKIVPKQALVESRMSMSEAGARQDKVLLGIEREIVIMKLIDHPNVLNLYDVWETKSELYIMFSNWCWDHADDQIPDHGVCSGRRTIRLPRQARTITCLGGSALLPADHPRRRLLSQIQHLSPRFEARELAPRQGQEHQGRRLWYGRVGGW